MIEIRRNTRLATVIAAGAAVVALAFLIRGGTVSAVIGVGFLLLAAAATWALIDGRTPLMVLDDQGVRMRLGRDWRGMPWTHIDEVEHMPRPRGAAGMWRDGRLAILPVDESAEVMALSDSSARQAAWTQRFFGVPFAVPLGMTTVVAGIDKPLTMALAELAGATTRVIEIDPDVDEVDVPVVEDTGAFTAVGPSWSIDLDAERVGPVRLDSVVPAAPAEVVDEPVAESPEPPVALTAVPAMRETVRPTRVEATFEPLVSGANALSAEFEPHTIVEIVEPEVEPAPVIEPVIGPQIAAARGRVGLSIDDLAERTRIRAHVIEAIEVDDDLFYVQFHHDYKPNEAVSLVIDLRAGRVLSIISEILPAAEKGRTRVQHHFGTATIDGVEATGSDFAPTTALIGRRVEWVYSPVHAYEHVYLSERWYTWQCLAGPERGLADTDENSVWEVRPGIFVFAWREKVIPCASVTIADHRDVSRIRSHGVLFGLDESGEVPTHFTFGAWGRLISVTHHAPELEPASFGTSDVEEAGA